MKRKEPEIVVQEQDEGSGDDNRDGERRYASTDSGDGGESDPPYGSDDENEDITVCDFLGNFPVVKNNNFVYRSTERASMKRKEPEIVVQEQDEGSGDDNCDGERRYASSDSGDGGESDPPSGSDDENDDSITVVIDSADLDCPVCLEPLHLPLFQCTNGHIICSRCCHKMRGKCRTCTRPISRKRCLPFESIIKSNEISCSYSRFGSCKVRMTYAQRHPQGVLSICPVLLPHSSMQVPRGHE